jgi:hypothetical protein
VYKNKRGPRGGVTPLYQAYLTPLEIGRMEAITKVINEQSDLVRKISSRGYERLQRAKGGTPNRWGEDYLSDAERAERKAAETMRDAAIQARQKIAIRGQDRRKHALGRSSAAKKTAQIRAQRMAAE